MEKVAAGFGIAGAALAGTDNILTQVASVGCLGVATGLVVVLHRMHRRVTELERRADDRRP